MSRRSREKSGIRSRQSDGSGQNPSRLEALRQTSCRTSSSFTARSAAVNALESPEIRAASLVSTNPAMWSRSTPLFANAAPTPVSTLAARTCSALSLVASARRLRARRCAGCDPHQRRHRPVLGVFRVESSRGTQQFGMQLGAWEEKPGLLHGGFEHVQVCRRERRIFGTSRQGSDDPQVAVRRVGLCCGRCDRPAQQHAFESRREKSPCRR
jgi:hypothetical protein